MWVKLGRSGEQVSAWYSFDGTNYAQIGATVTLTGAAAVQDAGIFSTSHDASRSALNVFSDLRIDRDDVKPTATLVAPTSTGPSPALALQVDATDDRGLAKSVANVYRDGALVRSTQTPVADGARAATHTASVTLPDGQYQLKYNAHDRAGNVSATGTFAFTIDATAPTVIWTPALHVAPPISTLSNFWTPAGYLLATHTRLGRLPGQSPPNTQAIPRFS